MTAHLVRAGASQPEGVWSCSGVNTPVKFKDVPGMFFTPPDGAGVRCGIIAELFPVNRSRAIFPRESFPANLSQLIFHYGIENAVLTALAKRVRIPPWRVVRAMN